MLAANYQWIAANSLDGANRWFDEFLRRLRFLGEFPFMYGLAPESELFSEPVRQAVFKTRRGRRYRLVYVVRGDMVTVFSIRGPGQPPIAPTSPDQ
jgi:hypothetical protein